MSIPVAVMRTGTVALPGLSVLADTDTGLYQAAANSLAIVGGGKLIANFVGGTTSVDSLKVTAPTTGNPLTLEAVGSDTDIGIKVLPKGAGQLQGPSGVVATPGYTFTGDLDSGVVRLGANNLALAAKAVAVVEVAASTTPVNWVKVTSGDTTAPALIAAAGETNVPLRVDGKGSGILELGVVSTGLVRIGTGSAKVHLGYRVNFDIDAQNATPTIAQLLGGVITHTSVTGAGTFTVPTGAAITAGVAGAATGDSFDVHYLNDGNQTVTITQGDANSAILGTAAVTTGKSATLRFVCTGAGVWKVYVFGIS